MLIPHDDIFYLVKLAKAGNHEAFASLTQRYESDLYRYLTRFLRDRDEAQDCVQQALFKAWRNLPTLKDEASFKPWLYVIGKNIVRDHMRKGKRVFLHAGDEVEDVESPALFEDCTAQAELIALAFAEVPLRLRICLCLDLRGFSHCEIAQRLGIGASSVSTYLTEARKQFRQAYHRLNDE